MSYEEDVRKSVEVLRRGGVILYPTDTIWGLGCDAASEEAVGRIHQIKRRPAGKSYILLVTAEMLERYVPHLSPALRREMTAGDRPTTYILEGVREVSEAVRAADGTAALRVPRDPFCQELLERFGGAIVSTSANFAGMAPPAHFGQVDPALASQADYVVRWRQDDRTPAQPSRILRILGDGRREVIRE